MAEAFHIRPARFTDCQGILAIYNDAVLHTTATYDYEPRDLAHRQQWFSDHEKDQYPIFVAEHTPTQGPPLIIGWSCLNQYRDRKGYQYTSENSIYVDTQWRGRGVGKLLMPPLIHGARQRGLRAILAGIDAENKASIRLHQTFGFESVAHFKKVGFKFNRWLDLIYMELWLED